MTDRCLMHAITGTSSSHVHLYKHCALVHVHPDSPTYLPVFFSVSRFTRVKVAVLVCGRVFSGTDVELPDRESFDE